MDKEMALMFLDDMQWSIDCLKRNYVFFRVPRKKYKQSNKLNKNLK